MEHSHSIKGMVNVPYKVQLNDYVPRILHMEKTISRCALLETCSFRWHVHHRYIQAMRLMLTYLRGEIPHMQMSLDEDFSTPDHFI